VVIDLILVSSCFCLEFKAYPLNSNIAFGVQSFYLFRLQPAIVKRGWRFTSIRFSVFTIATVMGRRALMFNLWKGIARLTSGKDALIFWFAKP